MMNYTETFNDFASRLGPTDLALYAGAAVIIYVLFKDQLSPVQVFIKNLLNKINWNNRSSNSISVSNTDDSFHKLVSSWKQTRDLAVANKCDEAVKAIDQMFPYLGPGVCGKEKV